jgi:hypothetical protein
MMTTGMLEQRTAPVEVVTPSFVVQEIQKAFTLNDKSRDYLRFHAKRFAYCANLVLASCRGIERPRVLDVAPHFTTFILRKVLPPGSVLNSLGWFDRNITGECVDKHFECDLNDVHFRDRWIAAEDHDVVMAGEIIEHVLTSPDRFIDFTGRFVAPGGRLIVGTPNAARIRNRLKLALGRNPYEMINERRDGHIREYTMKELCRACETAGLTVERGEYAEYWKERGILRMLERVVPSFRRGMTVIAVRK